MMSLKKDFLCLRTFSDQFVANAIKGWKMLWIFVPFEFFLLFKDKKYRGQSYKANFGINYIKNGFNKLNFTSILMQCMPKSFIGLTPGQKWHLFELEAFLNQGVLFVNTTTTLKRGILCWISRVGTEDIQGFAWF